MEHALNAFLLGFPALFAIVNPVSGAFLFRTRTVERSPLDRKRIARRVAIYAACVMLVALWAGSYVLAFFGITLPALRCAGGIVLALYAWSALNAPERREERRSEVLSQASLQDDPAFFPLTLPFTTGPGTISVAVALGSGHPGSGAGLAGFFIGMSAAAACMAVVIWLLYAMTDEISRLFGQTGSRVITRLSAFFQLCIGVQFLITGVTEAMSPLLGR